MNPLFVNFSASKFLHLNNGRLLMGNISGFNRLIIRFELQAVARDGMLIFIR
jgi:hypothetical protein